MEAAPDTTGSPPVVATMLFMMPPGASVFDVTEGMPLAGPLPGRTIGTSANTPDHPITSGPPPSLADGSWKNFLGFRNRATAWRSNSAGGIIMAFASVAWNGMVCFVVRPCLAPGRGTTPTRTASGIIDSKW